MDSDPIAKPIFVADKVGYVRMTWYICTECGWTSGAALTDDKALYSAFNHEDETGHEIEEQQEPHPTK